MLYLMLPVLLMLATARDLPSGRSMHSDPVEECCSEKVVGGIRYINIGSLDPLITKELKCLSPCMFMIEGFSKSRFCFGIGDLEVDCLETGDPEAPAPDDEPVPAGDTGPCPNYKFRDKHVCDGCNTLNDAVEFSKNRNRQYPASENTVFRCPIEYMQRRQTCIFKFRVKTWKCDKEGLDNWTCKGKGQCIGESDVND